MKSSTSIAAADSLRTALGRIGLDVTECRERRESGDTYATFTFGESTRDLVTLTSRLGEEIRRVAPHLWFELFVWYPVTETPVALLTVPSADVPELAHAISAASIPVLRPKREAQLRLFDVRGSARTLGK